MLDAFEVCYFFRFSFFSIIFWEGLELIKQTKSDGSIICIIVLIF